MSGIRPGADELRIRSILKSRGVGPDAAPISPRHAGAPASPLAAPAPEWWDDLYGDDSSGAPVAGSPAGEPDRRRIQPWWSGRPVDLTPDDEPASEPAAEEDTAEPDEAPDEEPETCEDDSERPGRWDPVAIADRAVAAYRNRPASVRLRHAADVVVRSKARIGQLVYTATGVWAAWRIGFTPWLLHFDHDAPAGIPIVVVGVGWAVNRRLDGAPLVIAWAGRAVYTATVINLVLHP